MNNKELPKIFKNTETKKITNNTKVFCSFYDNPKNEFEEKENEERNISNASNNYYKTIDELFNNHNFVFNVPVEIETKEGKLHTKIVSKIEDHILTSDSKIIKLQDILSIKIKGR